MCVFMCFLRQHLLPGSGARLEMHVSHTADLQLDAPRFGAMTDLGKSEGSTPTQQGR